MQADAAEPGLPTSAEVERALAEAFARPELTPRPPSPVQLWVWERLNELRQWFARTFGGFEPTGEGIELLSWLVVGGLVVVAAVLVIRLAAAGSARWSARERRRVVVAADLGSPDEGPTYWEEQARRAAAAGEWRDAALALYQALLLRLDARDLVRYDAAKTPGDYRREVRPDPRLARAFDRFLGVFEPVAFGARPLGAEGYGRLRALAAETSGRG